MTFLSKLLNRLKKYKESCATNCGYTIHGEAEELVFQSVKAIEKYEYILKNLSNPENEEHIKEWLNFKEKNGNQISYQEFVKHVTLKALNE